MLLSGVMNALLSLTRQPGLPLTLRKKIGRFLKPAAGQNFELPVFDARYHGVTGVHMDDKIYLYGLHEPATLRLLRAILRWQRQEGRRPVYFDIGTNKGLHLLAAAPLCDYAAGFEPWDTVRRWAEKNISANGWDHVRVMPFGLSDTDTALRFVPPANNNLGAGHFMASPNRQDALTDGGHDDPETAITLPVRTGDSVVAELDLVPSLLKIDVEGFEHHVLKGLRKTLDTHEPPVIFEYSDTSRETLGTDDARQALFGPGYSYYGLKRSRENPILVPFNPVKKYENVLAWPYEIQPMTVLK